MVGFDVELESELTIDCLNELAQMRMQVAKLIARRTILFLRHEVTRVAGSLPIASTLWRDCALSSAVSSLWRSGQHFDV
jgi:hypothetical protein